MTNLIQSNPLKITWEFFVFFVFNRYEIEFVYLKFQGMKKMLVLVLVSVASAAYTFAINPSDYKVFYKLNNKAAQTALIGYIDADQEQTAFLQHVFKATEEEMKTAVKNNNEAAVENVTNYNLRNAKCILSEEQYRKYIVFVNVYLNNENNFALLSDNK
jgi:hypothetical protein